MAYLVTQRTREIGVRLAIGARPADVFRLIVLKGLGLAAIGIAAGLAVSILVSRALQAMLFNVRPGDPATFIVAAAALASASLVATCLPALRAARVAPVTALRCE
jgi:ABC-type antimicrobial peptide transport system permease subunit